MTVYKSTQLSPNFTLAEATTTQDRVVDNSIVEDSPLFLTVQRTAFNMECVRSILFSPIHVNSWYRCLELNRKIGSKDTSDHRFGQAVDFVAPKFGTPLQVCKKLLLRKDLLGFKQLILEHTWVHISWELQIPTVKPKLQVLSLLRNGSYAAGLTDSEGNSLA